jgi:hypothetical protein
MCLHVDTNNFFVNEKRVVITNHAIRQAVERNIAYPDLVYNVLRTGKLKKFGKHRIKFIGRNIICVGEIRNQKIVIITSNKAESRTL